MKRSLGMVTFCLLTILLTSRNSIAEYRGPVLKIPMLSGPSILVTVEAGGRVANVLGGGIDAWHTGNGYYSIDFDDRYDGDFAVAAATGVVTEVVSAGCFQRGPACYVLVDHGGGYTTKYYHLRDGSVRVAPGVQVLQGQVLGTIGTTGDSSGTHLHFELRYNGSGRQDEPALGGVMMDGRLFEQYRVGQFYQSTNIAHVPLYRYDGNGVTCLGPLSGGDQAHDWVYTCENRTDRFNQNQTALGLVRIDEVYGAFRFKVEAHWFDIQNAVWRKQWDWTDRWYTADPQWSWRHASFWPSFQNPPPGQWQMRVFLDTGTGFQQLTTLSFTSVLTDPSYRYDGNGVTCRGPVSGGANTNWQFTCQNLTNSFRPGETVYGLVRIDRVWVRHRFRVRAYNNGNQWWSWAGDWQHTDTPWMWNTAYFWPRSDNTQAGQWEFRIDVDTGNGFQQIKVLAFTVR